MSKNIPLQYQNSKGTCWRLTLRYSKASRRWKGEKRHEECSVCASADNEYRAVRTPSNPSFFGSREKSRLLFHYKSTNQNDTDMKKRKKKTLPYQKGVVRLPHFKPVKAEELEDILYGIMMAAKGYDWSVKDGNPQWSWGLQLMKHTAKLRKLVRRNKPDVSRTGKKNHNKDQKSRSKRWLCASTLCDALRQEFLPSCQKIYCHMRDNLL